MDRTHQAQGMRARHGRTRLVALLVIAGAALAVVPLTQHEEELVAQDGAPSYARDVAPILRQNCTTCHRPGGLGPFSLLDYETVKSHRDDIRMAVEDREMPPWHAEGMHASVPILAVTPEHYNRMHRILRRRIPVKVEVEIRNRIGERVEKAQNLIAEIPGTDPRAGVVMLGAHFDTWHGSPNASDNTSGVAVALEAMRILKAVGARPRRTIRIALWSGEEQGLFGSRAYVREHFGDPRDSTIGVKPAYEMLSAYFNQDYGAGQYRGIYLQGNDAARGMMTAWMQPFRDLGMTAVSNQSVGSTDHIPLDDVGLPGFQFLQDRTPGRAGHTSLDYFEGIQPEDLMKNATIMASYVYHAAMAAERVPRKRRPAAAAR